MQQYTGTKTINAEPMNRLDYNKLRGWELPADENGDDEGYLVEYADEGLPNHKDYKGYISWSPKEVFEKWYKPSDSYQDRLAIETNELDEKICKLKSFTLSEEFGSLEDEDQFLLSNQLQLMRSYHNILIRRSRKLKPKKILMGRDNPSGAKLEALLGDVSKEVQDKSGLILKSEHPQRDMILEHNAKIVDFLNAAKEIQVETYRQLDAIAPNEGPLKPRL